MTATIALVDDDKNILTSVTIALEAEGYKVKTYTDGHEALRALATAPVDLAVLDIKMPRMDGMELLRRIRETSSLPVIFLTSKDDEVDEVLGEGFRPVAPARPGSRCRSVPHRRRRPST